LRELDLRERSPLFPPGSVAIFAPTSALAANTTYVATITTGVQNLAAPPASLAANFTWSFTTGAAPVALALQRTSDAKVAVAANSDATEKAAYAKASRKKAARDAAALRAVNTKDYLVTEKGIDASRVEVYTGASDSRAVDTTLIPAGAALDTTGLTPVDESVKPIPRTTVPKR